MQTKKPLSKSKRYLDRSRKNAYLHLIEAAYDRLSASERKLINNYANKEMSVGDSLEDAGYARDDYTPFHKEIVFKKIHEIYKSYDESLICAHKVIITNLVALIKIHGTPKPTQTTTPRIALDAIHLLARLFGYIDDSPKIKNTFNQMNNTIDKRTFAQQIKMHKDYQIPANYFLPPEDKKK